VVSPPDGAHLPSSRDHLPEALKGDGEHNRG
jgi:hypothetical protein